MILRIYGPTKYARINIAKIEDLESEICKEFDTKNYKLFKDKEHTKELKMDQIKNGDIIYIDHKVEYKNTEKSIKRGRDNLMCNHGDNAMCSHCAPLDVWDEDYHKKMGIKYISYRSYKEMKPDEVNIRCTHDSNVRCINCTEQVRLKGQIFRTCDHVEFDSDKIVEEFVNFNGKEKFGFLIGKYLDYDRVPLGIKAVVSAIYEPDQENYPDGFVVNDLDPDVNNFLSKFDDMRIVGMIYTKIYTKNEISALELEFISRFQRIFSEEDHSKFVTCIFKKVDDIYEIEPIQVSQQGENLILNKKIIPTTTDKFYSKTDIRYKKLNEYQKPIEVREKYIPLDFFIIKPTEGHKNQPYFQSHRILTKLSKKKLSQYFDEFDFYHFSNFSFLLRVFKNVDFEIKKKDFEILIEAVKNKNLNLFDEFKKSESFEVIKSTLEGLTISWACNQCTFINRRDLSECEMCGLPRY